jgi:flagellar basal-body rod modification protein FlgD
MQSTSAATAASDPASTPTPPAQDLNNMFLQLLVAQLKSQSPLDPMDPTQFVGQLAQFNSLSELTQIRQILAKIAG